LFKDGKPSENPQCFEFDTSGCLEPHNYIPVLCGGWYYFVMGNFLFVLDNGIIELAELPEPNDDDMYKLYSTED
jgi:hypothetical protein